MLVYGLLILVIIIFLIRSSSLNMIQEPKTWTSSERTRSIFLFLWKFISYLGLSAIFISLGLMMGVIGYHWAAGLSWIDSLVEASMILSGMGPISPLSTTSAKVFASLYALFSGLVFVIAMGILLSPLVYSLLSQFRVHLNNENYQQDEHLAK
ncbi:hypothetical protein [Okeania sp. SIO3B5]|uniref:hypothetical protein n=2 Tax=unclassified Okeania TaxID=2634635 RepID=UPI0025CC96C8|nr:hypothetical protein [Okeania sp. SIO3B5]